MMKGFNLALGLTLWVLLAVLTSTAHAHQFELGEAFLSAEEGRYRLVVSADLIEAFEVHLELGGAERALIRQVRALDEQTIERSLEEIQQTIEREVRVRFDGVNSPLTELSFPSAPAIRGQLDLPPDGREYRLVFTGYGTAPEGANEVSIQLPALLGDLNLEVTTPSNTLLQAGEPSPNFRMGGAYQTGFSVAVAEFLAYVWQGIIHIVPRGLDHILFVLGLFLIARNLLDLLLQVTAFTVAHTVTLTLGWLGYVNLPSTIVEPLIALSIVYVAVENILRDRPAPSRLAIIFVFGLLHGLGFASVLMEISPIGDQWVARALGFNVGVELGQLLVIAAAFVAVGFWRNRDWYRQRVIIPASAAIAVVGAIWTVQRSMELVAAATS